MELNAGIVIIIPCILFPVTLIITYTMSLYNRHVIPLLPYISHTGDDSSESCFFSFGLNIVAGFYALIVFLRFAQFSEFLNLNPNRALIHLNACSFVWGLVCSFTLSTTASFQQRNVGIVHVLAAIACSYTSLIYFWHQTVFSYFYCPTKRIRGFRVIIILCSTATHIFAPILYMYCMIIHPMPLGKITELMADTTSMALYITGSFLEWFVFIFNVLYTASLYPEFTGIKLKIGEIIIDQQRFLRTQ